MDGTYLQVPNHLGCVCRLLGSCGAATADDELEPVQRRRRKEATVPAEIFGHDRSKVYPNFQGQRVTVRFLLVNVENIPRIPLEWWVILRNA